MNELIRYAKSKGAQIHSTVDLSLLRVAVKDRESDERIRFSDNDLNVMFGSPIWNGQESEDKRLEACTHVIHDSLYWIPILGFYSGARREELCGLATDNIQLTVPVPYISIRPNAFQSLKNPQSTRDIPLHPKIMRLGFAGYAAAIEAIGYDLLFPDLRPQAQAFHTASSFTQSSRSC